MNWDRDLLIKIFNEYKLGLLVLPISILIDQVLINFDFQSLNNYELSLKIALILASILYSINYFKNYSNKFDWHFFLVLLYFFCMIEINYSTYSIDYYHPEKWIMIPMLILYHSFYFKNIPKIFSYLWFLLLMYFFLRLTSIPSISPTDINMLSIFSYLLPFYAFTCGFNFLYLRNKYTNLMYLRDIELETSKRIEIENKIASQKAIKSMIEDLHNFIGQALYEFKLNYYESIKDLQLDLETKNEIEYSVFKVEDALRMNINLSGDSKATKDDFFLGVKKILFRRYGIYGRNVHIHVVDLESTDFIELEDPNIVHQLLSICREICTNDLKYGFGTTEWNWFYKDGLVLTVSARTKYTENDAGKGRKSITNRIKFLNGTKEESIRGIFYECKCYFPFKKNQS